jgi:hypothetical protein
MRLNILLFAALSVVIFLGGCGSGSLGGTDSANEKAVVVFNTGQTKSYEENGSEVTDGSVKDDGYYQKGSDHNYTRDDITGIVTDHATGLMWEDDVNTSGVTKPWLTSSNYTTCENNNSSPACEDTSGDTAATYCENLTLGGYDDWRLPSVEELENIEDYGRYSPAIDTAVFQNTGTGGYWSGFTGENHSYAWLADFNYGGVYFDNKGNTHYVRCIRP